MAAYHVEIRDPHERTIVMATVEASKVSDIDFVRSGDTLGILLNGETVAIGHPTVAQAQEKGYVAYRWDLNESGEPVKKKVR